MRIRNKWPVFIRHFAAAELGDFIAKNKFVPGKIIFHLRIAHGTTRIEGDSAQRLSFKVFFDLRTFR